MKAKSSFSGIVVQSTAKGAIGICIAVSAFIVGFFLWSSAGVGGAIVQLLK